LAASFGSALIDGGSSLSLTAASQSLSLGVPSGGGTPTISLSGFGLTANVNGPATANLVGGLTVNSAGLVSLNTPALSIATAFTNIGSSGAPISINGVAFPPNPNALVSSTDDVDLGEYGYNATEYEYNATEYKYNVTEYEYKATDYEYNVTEYVYEYEDNGIMQKLNAAGIGN